jgi:hypothetical protein
MYCGYLAACSKIGINLDFGTARVHLFLRLVSSVGKSTDEFRGKSTDEFRGMKWRSRNSADQIRQDFAR